MAPPAVELSPQPDIPSPTTDKAHLPPGLKPIPFEKLDSRSDEEIAEWLQIRHPVTSDKNVWVFWDSGFKQMAPWVQRSIINCVRRLGPGWTVHVVDGVSGSETSIYHYVDASYFHDAFNEKKMDGIFVGQHSGDLVRLPLLWLYGGVWMDAGMFLFRHLDDICWKKIEDAESLYDLAGFSIQLNQEKPDVECMLNGFIATKRKNLFIKKWHDIYLEVWKGKTNADGLHKHPLLKHLPLMCPPLDKRDFPDLKVVMEPFTDYLTHFMCFERTRKIIDPNDGFNGPEYYAKRILLAPALQEIYYFQKVTKWSGPRQFELLTAKRTGEDAIRDEKWHAAEAFVNDSLANTSIMKLSHGGGEGLESLADLWDSEEHKDKDNIEGTFAAYLRYGSSKFKLKSNFVPFYFLEIYTYQGPCWV